MKKMLGALALIAVVLPVQAADEAITLKKIKYDELGKHVVAQKGKVVIVDFWANY